MCASPQNAFIGEDNSVTEGLIGATTLIALNYAVVRFLYRHEAIEPLVEGNADVLIDRGRVMTDRLERNLITPAERQRLTARGSRRWTRSRAHATPSSWTVSRRFAGSLRPWGSGSGAAHASS